MYEARSVTQRVLFISVIILVAANLILLSINMASNKRYSNMKLIGDTIMKNAETLNNGVVNSFHAIAHSAASIPKFAVHAANIKTFIKPADTASVPVIIPMPNQAIADKPQAPTVPASTGTPAPLKTVASVKTVTPAALARGQDPYAWGNCTWWVSFRRSQINDPIPSSWGNATSWASRATADGYKVDHTPSPGAIMQIPWVDGGLGHVAFVESVDPDGTWHISEMNVLGLNVVDSKARPSSTALNYYFIHDK